MIVGTREALVAYVVQVPLAGGGTVLVEVAEEDAVAIERAARPGRVVGHAARTLEEGLAHVAPAVQAVLDNLRRLARSPDRVELTFGIKFTGEAGAIIARAAAEANFAVSLEWSAGTDTISGHATAVTP